MSSDQTNKSIEDGTETLKSTNYERGLKYYKTGHKQNTELWECSIHSSPEIKIDYFPDSAQREVRL